MSYILFTVNCCRVDLWLGHSRAKVRIEKFGMPLTPHAFIDVLNI
jgi:hypothetical protein